MEIAITSISHFLANSSASEPLRFLVAAREVALFLYKKADTCPFTWYYISKA